MYRCFYYRLQPWQGAHKDAVLVLEMKEAISHFAVWRNFRVLVYFFCPFVIPVPYQPQGTNFTASLY
jgi:hypothetical protein